MEKPGEVASLFRAADHDERPQYLGPKPHLPDGIPAPAKTELLGVSHETTLASMIGLEDHTVSSSSIVSPSFVASSSKRVNPTFLERCRAAFRGLENPNPLPDWFAYPWNYDHKDFDFKVFRPWFDYDIPAWPKGTDPLPEGYVSEGYVSERYVDVYGETENGPSIMAFICIDGVIVAVDSSVTGGASSPSCGHKFFRFNSHVIGYFAGEVADCELFAGCLFSQDEGKSAGDVSDWLVETQSYCNLKGLSGIVIAGWDDKGPSLYRLDGDGKLHQGVVFACGSCSENGYDILSATTFPFMSFAQAAKLARVALPMAVAQLKLDSGSGDYGDEARQSHKIGGSVMVYCVGRDVIGEVSDMGAIKEVGQG